MKFHRTLWSLILLVIVVVIAFGRCQPARAQSVAARERVQAETIAVPEPATYGLIGVGVLLLAIMIRRKNNPVREFAIRVVAFPAAVCVAVILSIVPDGEDDL